MKNIVVITGAASGIGKEFLNQIKDYEKNIDEIWAIDYNQEGLNLLKNEESKVRDFCIDLTNKEEILKYSYKLEEEKPNVLLLINNAGFGIFDHSENISLETKLNMVDLNVKAYITMIDYTLPYMKENSNILNVASCAGFQPIPYINAYASTKAFVISYSRALNQELKYRKIHVLAVTPFWTKTNFFDKAVVKDKKEVVIKYSVMYNAKDVVKKAIKDLYTNKDISCYGFINNVQKILTKLLPHKLVMKIWMKDQKYDGTPNIR